MDRVRDRIADKRVLGLVKAFLIAGILAEDGAVRGAKTGTPQGGILSPCLANIALSALDEHFAEAWETMMAGDTDRGRRRRRGEPLYRLVRYADDFVVLVSGTKAQAEALKAEVAAVLSPIGLRLAEEKTGVCHINEGFDFLGFRIQRKRKRGSNRVFVYSWPSKKALASIMAKIKAITRQAPTSRCRPCCARSTRRSGLDGLLPARLLQADVQLPRPLHVAARRWMAATKAPPRHLEVDQKALPASRHGPHAGAPRRRDRAVQRRIGAGHPVPLPRHEDREPVDQRPMTTATNAMTIGPVESRMRWKPHVRFGTRAGETDRR